MPKKDCVSRPCYSCCRTLHREAVRAAADCGFAEMGLSVDICSADREVAEIRGSVRYARHNKAEAYQEYLKSHCPAT